MKSDPIDLEYMERFAGIGRDMLESRVHALAREVRRLRASEQQLTEALTSVQTVSTRQCNELRTHRALSTLADTPEGAFLAEGLHQLALARSKYPGPYPLAHMLNVLSEESGEVARAHVHGEGPARIREEAAQVVGVCVRVAVECLDPLESCEACPHNAVQFIGATSALWCRVCGALHSGSEGLWESPKRSETRLSQHPAQG